MMPADERTICIPVDGIALEGDLAMPEETRSLVVFAHGSGSSRKSPRNRTVALSLRRHGVGTLLFDLLTREEERVDAVDGRLRFDIRLLARRLCAVTDWLASHPDTRDLRIGYFGASTGAAAALVAASVRPDRVGAVVSRGGRPDLAGVALERVTAPTLLIVGERDETVIDLNLAAMSRMRAPTQLRIIREATHLFEEPGTLEAVATLAASWFEQYLLANGKAGGTPSAL